MKSDHSFHRWVPFIVLTIVSLMESGCAPSPAQLSDYAVVRSSPVSPAIYDKMLHGDPLSVSDIAALGHARVNDGIIIRYIRDKDTVYYLSPEDIQYLLKAGVSQSVVDYMFATAPRYSDVYPYSPIDVGVGFGYGYGPYWHPWHRWR